MWNNLLTVTTGLWGRVAGVVILTGALWYAYHSIVSVPVAEAQDGERVCLKQLNDRIATMDELVALYRDCTAKLEKSFTDANISAVNAYDKGYAKGLSEGQKDAKVATDHDCFVIKPVF